MSAIGDYLKETRTELNHVAWPTRMQTTVYTVLVIAISIGIAVYLGFFDFIFTDALRKTVDTVTGVTAGQTQTQSPAATATSSASKAPVNLNLGTSTNK